MAAAGKYRTEDCYKDKNGRVRYKNRTLFSPKGTTSLKKHDRAIPFGMVHNYRFDSWEMAAMPPEQ